MTTIYAGFCAPRKAALRLPKPQPAKIANRC